MWDDQNDMIVVKDTLSVAVLMTPELILQQLELLSAQEYDDNCLLY
jgi:hypothetical protein